MFYLPYALATKNVLRFNINKVLPTVTRKMTIFLHLDHYLMTVETKWIILIYLFFKFNIIFYCKQPHFTIYFLKQRDIVFISDDRHWPSMIVSQYISFRVGRHEWEKDRIVILTNGTYLCQWSFVTQIFYKF
jgi:hypothetical protein